MVAEFRGPPPHDLGTVEIAICHRPTEEGETGAAWEFHGSDGSAGAPWLSIHLCRCGLAFTVCLGVVTPVASWCSMVQRDAPW